MKVTSDKWCKRFLKLAHEIASWSKDKSTQVGCVIVDPLGKPKSFGYNGLPRGVDDTVFERHERPEKYYWFEHAERNAIFQSPTDLTDCTMFVTHAPCADCARAIIQSGIKAVVVDNTNGFDSKFADRMRDSVNATQEMFNETNVCVKEINIEKDYENK